MSINPCLRTRGSQLVTAEGDPVILRGFGLGGWMNMENFITGYPANEEAQREAIREVLGPEKYEFFFDRFLEYFFTEDDARYVRSLGLNLIRIPVNYRHFEDDMNPFVIVESGFKHLDRVIALCARHGIYTIIDLHALPGYQNQDWHSDNPTHKALFWRHLHFQDRAVNLWEAFARHYRDNPWVAGYNPINEPYDPSETLIMPVYRRLVDAIRTIYPHHLIFLEGNRYSMDFHMFGDPWPGVVYTNHDYADPGFMEGGPYPGVTNGRYYDNEVLEEVFLKRSEYMLKHNLHIWVGEFGPVYTGQPENDAMRYRLLRDQLEIYRHHKASWSIWLYKDIGLQALTYAAPDSPWMQRVGPFVQKKARLGVDAWGGTEAGVRDIMVPLRETLHREATDWNPGPFGANWYAKRHVRHLLLSESLLPEFASLFAGLSETELDALMQSFMYPNCVIRQQLADLLSAYAA
jgi:hypothetical protein